MDYLISVTLRRLGIPHEAEDLLERFVAAAPDGSPAAGEDLEAQTLDVTFIVAGGTVEDALSQGQRIADASLRGERDAHEVIGVRLRRPGDLERR